MPEQNNWRYCHKCQGLSFDGNPSIGACPAGGQHDHDGSANYTLLYGQPEIAGQQHNWRWCHKCQGLFFGGNPVSRPCPAGGQHDHDGSADYSLPYGQPEAAGQQHNWRYCHKCQGLFFAGNPVSRPCPAGGQHDHDGSSDYVLTHDPNKKALPWRDASFLPDVGLSKRLTFQTWMGTFLSAHDGGGSLVLANRTDAQKFECFNMTRLDADSVTLQASNGQFICAGDGTASVVVANRNDAQRWGRFSIFVDRNGLISLQCNNGQFLCAEPHGVLMANRLEAHEWEAFRVIDPNLANIEQTQIQINVYKIGMAPFWHTGTVIDGLEYYFQTTNHVETTAPRQMNLEHHRTFVRIVPGDIVRIRAIRDEVINRWNGTRYDLGDHNCNFFTDDLLNSLGTTGLDREYLDASGLAKGLRQIPGGALLQELIVKWPCQDKRLDQAFIEDLIRLVNVPKDVRDECIRFAEKTGEVFPLPNWPLPGLPSLDLPLPKLPPPW